MVKKEVMANVIGLIGIFIGVVLGFMSVDAALYMNPQNVFTEHPWQLIFIFYSWVPLPALPFLLVRHVFLYTSRILLLGLSLSIFLSILIGLFFETEVYLETVLISSAHIYFLFHIVSFISKILPLFPSFLSTDVVMISKKDKGQLNTGNRQ